MTEHEDTHSGSRTGGQGTSACAKTARVVSGCGTTRYVHSQLNMTAVVQEAKRTHGRQEWDFIVESVLFRW